MTAAKSDTPNIDALARKAATLTRSADIARMIGASGKSVRARVRDGRLKDSTGKALAPVFVSKDGENALTDAHKQAIVRAFVKSDEDAAKLVK